MKKWMVLLLVMLNAWWAMSSASGMALDKVMFQTSAKQWVSTQSALLTITINATETNADWVKVRNEMLATLNKIVSGDWHLTQFDRSQDSSGLEKLVAVGQVRVPQANLADVYPHAKSVSKPGVSYTIASVEFKPSLEETQQVKQQLREHLYQSINQEIARLNSIYTAQHYTVSNIFFFEGDVPPVLASKAYQAQDANLLAMTTSPASPMSVSSELTMTAVVELASNRKEDDHAVVTR